MEKNIIITEVGKVNNPTPLIINKNIILTFLINSLYFFRYICKRQYEKRNPGKAPFFRSAFMRKKIRLS